MKKRLMLMCALVCAMALVLATGSFVLGFAYSEENKVTFTTEKTVDMTEKNWHYVQFGRQMEVYAFGNADVWYIDTKDGTDLNSVNFDGAAGTLTWKVDLPESATTFWASLAIAGNGGDSAMLWVSADNTTWTEMNIDLPANGDTTGYAVIDAHTDLADLNLTATEGVSSLFVKVGIKDGNYGFRVRGRLVFAHNAKVYSSEVADNLGLGDVYTTVEKSFEGVKDSAYLVYANGGATDSFRFFDGTGSNGTDAVDGQNRMDKIGVFHGIYKYTTTAGVKGLLLEAHVAGHALLEIYTGDKDISKANVAGAGATVLNPQLDENTMAAISLQDWVPLFVSAGNITHTVDISKYITADVAQTVYFRISDATDLNGGGGQMLGMKFTEYANMTAESYLYFKDDTNTAKIKAGENVDISKYLDPQLDFAGKYEGTVTYAYEYKVTGANAADATVSNAGVFTSQKGGTYTVEITLKPSNTTVTDKATFTVTVEAAPDKPDNPDTPDNPDNPNPPDNPDDPGKEENGGGCKSSVTASCLLAALVFVGGAVAIVCKKKA